MNQHFNLDEEEVKVSLRLMIVGLHSSVDLTPGERAIAKAVVHRFERAVNPPTYEDESE